MTAIKGASATGLVFAIKDGTWLDFFFRLLDFFFVLVEIILTTGR